MKYGQIYASGPTLKNLLEWEKKGANISTENGKIVDECDVIILAVKPQILPNAIANMYETVSKKHESKLFISVLVGVTLQQLENVSFFSYHLCVRSISINLCFVLFYISYN